MKELFQHESTCQKIKCENDLCGLSLEGMPDITKFTINGSEKFACSKKCKTVAKFAYMLKKNNENEVLKAFETMLRKKTMRKSQSSQPYGQKPHSFNTLLLSSTQKNDQLMMQFKSKASGLQTQRSRINDTEEVKESQQWLPIPKFSLFTDLHEFCWDSENSSKEISFSQDYRHAFLFEPNYYFRTIISNMPFSGGVHYWEIIADSRTEHELKIGVTTQQTFNVNSSFSDYEFGFAYYGLGQLRHGSNALGKGYGKQFKKKGILGVCLNMNAGTLSFSLDGEYLGLAFEDPQLKKGPIWVAVSLLHIAGCTLVSGTELPSYFPH